MKTTLTTFIILLFYIATLQAQSTDSITRYHWNGLINNKYPVDVLIERKGDILQGQIVYTYTKNKTPIKLLSDRLNDGGKYYVMYEMLPDGKISGVISGELTNSGGFEGTWRGGVKMVENDNGGYTYTEAKEYTISLTPSSKPAKHTFLWTINKDNCVGKYRYSYGENLRIGEIEAYKKNGKLYITAFGNRGAPGFIQALVEDQECIWKDGRFIFNNDFEEQFCEFELIPYNDFAIINKIGGEMPCGFGAETWIDGTFLKVKE